MKKVNCYLCEYVFRPKDMPMSECKDEDLSCGHPFYDGACQIGGVTKCPKSKRR